LQTSLQRRDSSRFEQTGQNREASSCPGDSPDIPAVTVPAIEVPLGSGPTLSLEIGSSTSSDALAGFTPHCKACFTAAPL
jgi:hypothetical protein